LKKKSHKRVKPKRAKRSKSDEANALRRTHLAAQKIARLYGMPIHFWSDGKDAAKKP
jgi:hypothetical protein